MKKFVFASMLCFTSLSTTATGSNDPWRAPGAELPVVTSVREVWPIAREASGYWGVIGEAVARNRSRSSTAVESVTLSIEGPRGSRIAKEVFDTPARLSSIVAVFGPGSGETLERRPAGTLVLRPGDAAVVFLAALTEPRSLPSRARIDVRFSRGPGRRIDVPLVVQSHHQRFAWPLRLDSEPWVAFNTAGTAHHWSDAAIVTSHGVYESQRFALDVLQIDSELRTHPPQSSAKEAFYAWNEDVLSVGRGRVVALLNDQRDIEVGEAPDPAAHPAGNHVVVQYERGVFAVYAHLQQGSVAVVEGDWVERGQLLGRVGNSGSTTEPHLHLHFTDRWAGSADPLRDFYFSQGLPATFWGAQVLRGGKLWPLRGTTPIDFDVIIGSHTRR